MIHTSLLLLMARFLIAHRSNCAMAAFGVAVAFKLQAIFVGPVIVALLLAGELPWISLPWIPLAYILMLVPAAIAGRPVYKLATLYSSQYSSSPLLGMNVANLYQLIEPLVLKRAYVTHALNTTALALAGTGTLFLIIYLSRNPAWLQGWRLLAATAAPLLLEPFLLPKMHDRYFFAGDVMMLVLALMRPSFALPAILLQASAVMVYYPFLFWRSVSTSYYIAPVAMTTLALVLFARILILDDKTDFLASVGEPRTL
jgi:Gpi18-like mannosyltransferase